MWARAWRVSATVRGQRVQVLVAWFRAVRWTHDRMRTTVRELCGSAVAKGNHSGTTRLLVLVTWVAKSLIQNGWGANVPFAAGSGGPATTSAWWTPRGTPHFFGVTMLHA
jgi:hypothetical protein